MIVICLGGVAGGGWPQWNCCCASCYWARSNSRHGRQAALAVRGEAADQWWLMNAPPDVCESVAQVPDLVPDRSARGTRVSGVLLSDSEIDSTLGLMSLREASGLTLVASPAVLFALSVALPLQSALASYTATDWAEADSDRAIDLGGGLSAQRSTVGTKRPRYAASGRHPEEANDSAGWVSAWRLHDAQTGGSIVYAPSLPKWTEEWEKWAAGADLVLIDGTFYSEDEMQRSGTGNRSASAMGHLAMSESMDALAALPAAIRGYTHLNNTNPVLIEGSTSAATLADRGLQVARHGVRWHL